MKALNLHGIGDLRLDEVPVPEPGEGEVLLKIRAVGICGSDIGRVFTTGTYHFPTIIGHEFAGEIVKATDKSLLGRGAAVFPLLPCHCCAACLEGNYAQCSAYDYYGSRRDGGMAEYLAVKRDNLCLMPEGVTYEEAAMTEPAAVARAAWQKGGAGLGSTVFVYGVGSIALILAQWARLAGASRIVLAARSEFKRNFARKLGFDLAIDISQDDIDEKIAELTEGRGADVCFEGTGASEGLNTCLKVVGAGKKVVALGNPVGDMHIDKGVYSRLMRQEVSLSGTWNSRRRPTADDWQETLEAIKTKKIALAPLITHRYPLVEYDQAFKLMYNKIEPYIKVMLFF